MGLRNRILLLVALGLLIATAPLGVMGLGMVRAATNRILEERLAIAQATAAHLSAQLAQGWSQLDRLSSSAAIGFREGNLTPIHRDLEALVPQMPLFSGGVYLVDAFGRVVAQEPSTTAASVPLARVPSIQDTLRLGRPQTGVVARNHEQRPLSFFSVPVFRTPTIVSGAVVGVIDLDTPVLLTFIRGLAMGTSGHAAIVSREGTVLASTNPNELLTQNEHPEFFRVLIEGGRPLVGRAEGHVTAFAPLSAAPWGVGIGQAEDEALGPIRRLRDRIIVFETLVLLAAMVFAWIDTTSVIRPIAILRQSAAKIAEGDLAQEVDVRRADEIGALARTFETMRLQLRRSLEENDRLQRRLQSVAMLEERERIAREMHDSVGQVLGYVNTKAQAVHTLLEAGRVDDASVQLRQLEEAAREIYADLREAILSLRTGTGPEHPLLPTLTEYVRRFTELSGVETRLEVEGDPAQLAFPPTVEAHLIRIIQEALTNIRKHAHAHRALVRFVVQLSRMTVAVEDDGVGFGPEEGREQPSGFGLQTMRERTDAIGGTMAIKTQPNGGTAVEISLPLGGSDTDARLAG